jgi:hypothetical protein
LLYSFLMTAVGVPSWLPKTGKGQPWSQADFLADVIFEPLKTIGLIRIVEAADG